MFWRGARNSFLKSTSQKLPSDYARDTNIKG
jgi:hypothetical protein